MIAAVLVPLMAQAPAQAAQAAQNGAAGTTAWTPQIYQLFSGEWVERDVSGDKRRDELIDCSRASGIACVAVGQGDGKRSILRAPEARRLAEAHGEPAASPAPLQVPSTRAPHLRAQL
ncbi:hypothetical protein AB0K68_19150 [Streptomyces sp. NPDC050698]